jgi:hypothetical protein
VPTLPAGAVVGIWFGYNAGQPHAARRQCNGLALARCVNGLGKSVFTQYAYCNAPAFFAAVKTASPRTRLTVPALGTGRDGQSAARAPGDFSIVDQDQSDNVTTQYLATANGSIAQNTSGQRRPAAQRYGAGEPE